MLSLHPSIKDGCVKHKTILIVFFVTAFFFLSCDNRHESKDISEGEIHYNITYTGNLEVPRMVLPKTLVVYFKQNKILFEMISVFGNSGILNLSNPEDKIYDTYFSLFTLKYYYQASEGELFPGFDDMEGIEINKTSKKTDICGFHCKNAEITLPYDRNKIINIWYTNDIDVKNSNLSTPYKDIEGVLMDFSFFLGETEIHFVAENVYSKTINDNTFARRDNYQQVSKEEISKFIEKMTNF